MSAKWWMPSSKLKWLKKTLLPAGLRYRIHHQPIILSSGPDNCRICWSVVGRYRHSSGVGLCQHMQKLVATFKFLIPLTKDLSKQKTLELVYIILWYTTAFYANYIRRTGSLRAWIKSCLLSSFEGTDLRIHNLSAFDELKLSVTFTK